MERRQDDDAAGELAGQLMWYGKIPASGDFVHRRMPVQVLQRWERWFSAGISHLAARGVLPVLRRPGAPSAWGFVMPATLGSGWVQLGSLMLSQDRVGREYPICIILRLSPAQLTALDSAQAVQWIEQFGRFLQQAISQRWEPARLDAMLCDEIRYRASQLLRGTSGAPPRVDAGRDILDVLYGPDVRPSSVPSLDQMLTQHAAAESTSSYWWTAGLPSAGWRSVSHTGELTTALFRQLFSTAHRSGADRLRRTNPADWKDPL